MEESDLKELKIQNSQFSWVFFEWRELRFLLWKLAANFVDSREDLFECYRDSRENLFEILAVVIVLSLISSARGIDCDACVIYVTWLILYRDIHLILCRILYRICCPYHMCDMTHSL